MYIRRHMEQQLLKAAEHNPVLIVCGQRQVGKSTMLCHIKEEKRRYVTLDDAKALNLALKDSALFFETYGNCLLIDEIQRAPQLLLEIKRIVDGEKLKGKSEASFWLTGSQKFELMQGVSESLAGRAAVFELSSLTTAELENRPAELFSADLEILKKRTAAMKMKSAKEIYERIFQGGMPVLCAENADRERYYSDYVNTYLERDIKELAQVGSLTAFFDFLVYMAARTGQELKYEDIARSIGISAPTAKNWVSILERSGVILLLRPYFSNLTSRLVKTPKVYFTDTGLAAWLCRWETAEVLMNGAMDGAFLETYVVTEIWKSCLNSGKRPNLYYYRDVDKREIDLLLAGADRIYPIEIKKNKLPAVSERNLRALGRLKMKIEPELIICLCDELMPLSREVWMCPASVI